MKHLRQYIRQILLEQRKFILKGNSRYFRVDMLGIGNAYVQGGVDGNFQNCKDEVEAIKQMPEYLEAKEKFEANNTYGEYKVVDGKRVRVEVPMPFYPKFYSVDNAWIDDQEMRGKGHGKAIYKEWIRQAVKYSEGYGGVFIAGAHCTQTPNATSEDAKRVWKSLIRDYPTSSGLVIFIGEGK